VKRPGRRGAGEKPPKVLQPVSKVVAPWLEKLGFGAETAAVFEAWDRLVGGRSARAEAVGLKRGVLVVETDSSVRLHDLTLRKPQLLKKLLGYFGGKGAKVPVSDIIFRISDEDRRG
jgi:predicted nucleic acid-binding Zn ribbon protein